MIIYIKTYEVTLKGKFCLKNPETDIHGITTIEICVQASKCLVVRLKHPNFHLQMTYLI